MADNRAITKVRPEEKQSAASLAFIWIGGIISAPALMIGAALISGLDLKTSIIVIFIGFLAQAILMTLNGMQASDLGYPAPVLLGKTFGEIGSRFILSGLISILQFVQAGIQVAVCGGAFYAALASFGITIFPVWVYSLFWGFLMVLTAVYGYGWMKILNYLAVPFLIIVCIWATARSALDYGIDALFSYQPENPMSFVSGLSIVIGMLAMGTLTTTNLTRFSKSRLATLGSTFLGIIPAALLMLTMGAVMSLTAGTSDITELFVKLGMPVLGVLALVLATWTTNTTNFYMMGINLVRVFAAPEKKRAMITGIAGLISTVLAIFGVLNIFSSFMSFLAAIFPSLAGIMIEDYWVIGRGKPESFGIIPGINWIGVAAWVVGALFGLFFKAFCASFVSIIVSIIVYCVFYYIFKSKLPETVDPEVYVGSGDDE